MRLGKRLNSEQKKVLKHLLNNTERDFEDHADICLVAAKLKHHGTQHYIDRDKFEKFYIPAFKKTGTKFVDLDKLRGCKSDDVSVLYTQYNIPAAVKRYKKNGPSFSREYLHKFFPEYKEWIPYILLAFRCKFGKVRGPGMTQKTIDDAKRFHTFIKRDFPEIDGYLSKKEIISSLGYSIPKLQIFTSSKEENISQKEQVQESLIEYY